MVYEWQNYISALRLQMNQTNFLEEERQLVEAAKETLRNIQKLFKDNGIGPNLGSSLLLDLIKFTFDGNATVGENADDAGTSWRESPHVKQMMEDLKDVVACIELEGKDVINDLYSDIENDFGHMGMIRETFLETIFGKGTTLDEGLTDGTVGVLSCIAASGFEAEAINVGVQPKH